MNDQNLPTVTSWDDKPTTVTSWDEPAPASRGPTTRYSRKNEPTQGPDVFAGTGHGQAQVALGIARGVWGAVENTLELVAEIDEWTRRRTGIDEITAKAQGAPVAPIASPARAPSQRMEKALDAAPKPSTTLGTLAEPIAAFATDFMLAGKILRPIKALQGAGASRVYLRTEAKSIIADLAAFDGQSGNFSSMLQAIPEIGEEYNLLLATDANTPEVEGRFKNAVEGFLLGQVLGLVGVAGSKFFGWTAKQVSDYAADHADQAVKNVRAQKAVAAAKEELHTEIAKADAEAAPAARSEAVMDAEPGPVARATEDFDADVPDVVNPPPASAPWEVDPKAVRTPDKVDFEGQALRGDADQSLNGAKEGMTDAEVKRLDGDVILARLGANLARLPVSPVLASDAIGAATIANYTKALAKQFDGWDVLGADERRARISVALRLAQNYRAFLRGKAQRVAEIEQALGRKAEADAAHATARAARDAEKARVLETLDVSGVVDDIGIPPEAARGVAKMNLDTLRVLAKQLSNGKSGDPAHYDKLFAQYERLREEIAEEIAHGRVPSSAGTEHVSVPELFPATRGFNIAMDAHDFMDTFAHLKGYGGDGESMQVKAAQNHMAGIEEAEYLAHTNPKLYDSIYGEGMAAERVAMGKPVPATAPSVDALISTAGHRSIRDTMANKPVWWTDEMDHWLGEKQGKLWPDFEAPSHARAALRDAKKNAKRATERAADARKKRRETRVERYVKSRADMQAKLDAAIAELERFGQDNPDIARQLAGGAKEGLGDGTLLTQVTRHTSMRNPRTGAAGGAWVGGKALVIAKEKMDVIYRLAQRVRSYENNLRALDSKEIRYDAEEAAKIVKEVDSSPVLGGDEGVTAVEQAAKERQAAATKLREAADEVDPYDDIEPDSEDVLGARFAMPESIKEGSPEADEWIRDRVISHRTGILPENYDESAMAAIADRVKDDPVFALEIAQTIARSGYKGLRADGPGNAWKILVNVGGADEIRAKDQQTYAAAMAALDEPARRSMATEVLNAARARNEISDEQLRKGLAKITQGDVSLAARSLANNQALGELTDEVVALTAKVAGGTASEAERLTLVSLRVEQLKTWAVGREAGTELGRAVNIQKLVKGERQRGIQAQMEAMRALGIDPMSDAITADLIGVTTVEELIEANMKLVNGHLGRWYSTVFFGGLLGSPVTHAANFLGNGIQMALSIAEAPIVASSRAMRRRQFGANAVGAALREPVRLVAGYAAGAASALRFPIRAAANDIIDAAARQLPPDATEASTEVMGAVWGWDLRGFLEANDANIGTAYKAWSRSRAVTDNVSKAEGSMAPSSVAFGLYSRNFEIPPMERWVDEPFGYMHGGAKALTKFSANLLGGVSSIPLRALAAADEVFTSMLLSGKRNAIVLDHADQAFKTEFDSWTASGSSPEEAARGASEARERVIKRYVRVGPDGMQANNAFGAQMVETARDFARYGTYREQTKLAQGFNSLLKNAPYLRPIMAFTSTPVAIFKDVVYHRSTALVIAPVMTVAKGVKRGAHMGRLEKKHGLEFTKYVAAETLRTIANGGDKADLTVARAIIGGAMMATAWNLAGPEGDIRVRGSGRSGRSTDDVGGDPANAISFDGGKTWRTFNRVDPIGWYLTIVADVRHTVEDLVASGADSALVDDVTSIMGAAFVSLTKSLEQKAFFTGISAALEAISDPERFGEQWSYRLLQMLTPMNAALRAAETQVDPMRREVEDHWEALLALIPGQSDKLAISRDLLGRPVVDADPTLLRPWKKIEVDNDPLFAELDRLEVPYQLPSRVGDTKLTKRQQSRLLELRGQEVKFNGLTLEANLRQYVQSAEYRALDTDEARWQRIQQRINLYQSRATERLLDEDKALAAQVKADKERVARARAGQAQ